MVENKVVIRLRRFFGIPENTGFFEKPKKTEKDKELGKNKIKMLVFQLILAENL